jgi:hypothetical protein
VTTQFPNLVSHCSSAFLRGIHLMVLATQLTAVLHAGSRVSCHSFLNVRLRSSRLSRSGRLLFRTESIILLVESLYAEAVDALNRWSLYRLLRQS